ncbi:somatostatin receptor type 2-like [Belonocnema kinseyi]|uniref:somatostatin receptor type 2-like n=1 Tax=Belonocnema kinseyi TaxID=2817044 RepID=UPI00143CFA17|nr:somatostatin receptor type 2-like [Belonocnema kinseyi]
MMNVSLSDDFNSTNNSTSPFHCSTSLSVTTFISQVIYSGVCIAGLVGNTMVIYVVTRFSKMQTVTNIYILNLAVADECFLIGIPFLLTTMTIGRWTFGTLMCKIYMTTTSINQFTSSIFIFIMSADRYIAVCHPISSPQFRTPFISRIVSVGAWVMSAIFMIPVILYANAANENGQVTCNILWPDQHGGQTSFTLYTFILGYVIPLILVLVFYILVLRKLQTVGPQNRSNDRKRSNRKVTTMVLTVIAAYILCWAPYWITQMSLIFTPPNECQSELTITMFLLAGVLAYCNSAMNPILYAFLSDNFRKSFAKACTCAAYKEVNANLHIENSVFPRKNKGNTERLQVDRVVVSAQSKAELEEEEDERGLLISKTSTTGVTMTSRTNITISSGSRDMDEQERRDKDIHRNGAQHTLLTQV